MSPYDTDDDGLSETPARALAMVLRGDRILMVKHRHEGQEWWCLPAGSARHLAGELKPSFEHDDIAWYDPAGLPDDLPDWMVTLIDMAKAADGRRRIPD